MRVAVVGATGAVGTLLLALLERRAFPADEVVPFASARSAGKQLGSMTVQPLADDTIQGFDVALFSAGGATSREWAPRFAAARRARGRQLVGVAHGPRGPARRLRGQPRRAGPHRQGHRRQPELHDDGGHAAGQGAARRLRPDGDGLHLLPGRRRRGPEGHGRAPRPGRPRPRARPRQRRRRGRRVGRGEGPRQGAGLQRRAVAGHGGRGRLQRRGDEAAATSRARSSTSPASTSRRPACACR